MRCAIVVALSLGALSVYAAGAERPAQLARGDIIIAAADPNAEVPPAGGDPNRAWNPAEHLAADWESISVTMTSRLYNPAVQPDAAAQGPQWSLSLAGIVDIIDSNGLIGWSSVPTSVLALDEAGQVVAGDTSASSVVRYYQQPKSLSMAPGFPSSFYLNRVSLNLPIDPHAAYPDLFSRVEWTQNVLVADEIKKVDVPFKTSDTWAELTPGVEILVEQAIAEQGKYQYRIKVRYDSTNVDYMMGGSVHLWRDELPPTAAVLNMEILNAEGKSVRGSGGGGFSSSGSYSGSNGLVTGTASGSGTCDACGAATTLRYTLAFNLYELEARFVLANVPVPEF